MLATPLMYSPAHYGGFESESCQRHSRTTAEGQTRLAMAIPGVRTSMNVPPALPPPRHIDGLDEGIDLGWHYQNLESAQSGQKLAPIRFDPAQRQYSRDNRRFPPNDDRNEDVDMDDNDSDGKQFSMSSLARTQSLPQSRSETTPQRPDLIRGISSGIGQSLRGDPNLAQQNHHRLNEAYDQQLLQRISKSGSPPRGLPISINTQIPSLLTRAARPFPVSSVTDTSSRSATSSAAFHNYGFSGVRDDAVLPPASPASSLPAGPFDYRTRSERGSHDSVMSLDGRTPQGMIESGFSAKSDRPLTNTLHGSKRQALSPPSDLGEFGRLGLSQRSQQPSSNPSTASSSSYRSSFASSSIRSSISNITVPSMDPQTPRHPVTSPKVGTSTGPSSIAPRNHQTSLPDATASPRDDTSQSQQERRHNRVGTHFICSCCPKKPRKFGTENQLRAHESEKQYTCAFCHNRFKNKNEAERHQNSLHVRKQSWSCAAIKSYHAAFYSNCNSNTRSGDHDVCGFCGDLFSNDPVNWEERMEHVINIHKFAECNTTKKFYRADHFRQHLKHSHAGKTGKWTNILENNCQREEEQEPTDIVSLSPAASDHSINGSLSQMQGMNPTGMAYSGVTANDAGASHDNS